MQVGGTEAQDDNSERRARLALAVWRAKTELFALWARLLLGFLMLAVYVTAPKPADAGPAALSTFFVIIFFVAAAAVRIASHAARRFERSATLLSPLIDFALLGVLIDSYQRIYSGGAALSLHAPTFSFYLVFIAMHGMRLDWRHSAFAGICAIASWCAVAAAALYRSGADSITHEYAEYALGGKILIGAEIERLISLAIATAAACLAGRRAEVLSQRLMAIGTAVEREKAAAEREYLIRAKAAADRANELKSEFLAKMSHELRTPLNGVLGFADVIDWKATDPEIKANVEVIRSSGHSLLKLINQILEASSLNSDAAAFANEPYNLRGLICDVVDEYAPRAKARGLFMRLELDELFPGAAHGDEARLFIAISAVLDNAVKFTEAGEIIVSGTRNGDAAGDEFAILSVRDTGIGIAEKDLQRIFDQFEQADNSFSRHYDGAGLGLSISRSIVRAHGGDIDASSSLGAGATFTIRLPVSGKLCDRPERRRRMPGSAAPQS